MLKAGPKHEIVRTNTIDEPVYSSLAIANGRIYIRGEKHLFAIGGDGRERSMIRILAIAITIGAAATVSIEPGAAAFQEVLQLDGDVAPVHDPAVIKEGNTYYVFCTGGRSGQGVIPIRTSTNLRTWKSSGFAFDALPEWATREIPQARNAWAPDISRFNGKFHLYYSVSSFGSRNSAIGLATTPTLDQTSRDLSLDRRRAGAAIVRGQGRLECDRSEPGDRGCGERLARVGQLLEWNQNAARRSVDGQSVTTDTTLYSLSSRPRDAPIGGSVEAAVHHPARRFLVSLRLLRSLLPRRRQHLQRRRRAGASRDRAVRGQDRQGDDRRRRLAGDRRDDSDLERAWS